MSFKEFINQAIADKSNNIFYNYNVSNKNIKLIRDSYKNRNKKIVNKTVVAKKTKAKKNPQTQTTSLLNSSKTYKKTLLG
jgi:hypothetical protein